MKYEVVFNTDIRKDEKFIEIISYFESNLDSNKVIYTKFMKDNKTIFSSDSYDLITYSPSNISSDHIKWVKN